MCPELFRADMEDTASRLTSCYNRLWETERWPKVWRKGLLVKVFKKGDLHECNNCRGPTLLHIISKIFCRMLLERIKKGVDKKLRKDQTGFRPKRSTFEQIFILRNISAKANEWRAGLNAHFVDFKKALDSAHRESLWNIMRSYRIPDKMMRVIAGIRGLWLRSCRRECYIRKVYDQVWGTTGVRDFRNTILTVLGLGHEEGKSRQEKRVRWYFTTVLEDLDIADDIELLSSKHGFANLRSKLRCSKCSWRTG